MYWPVEVIWSGVENVVPGGMVMGCAEMVNWPGATTWTETVGVAVYPPPVAETAKV